MPSVREIILRNCEPTEPQNAILAFLKANDGKRLDKPRLEKLKAAVNRPDLRVYTIAGMSHIEWGNYGNRGNGNEGGSLLIAYTTACPVINAGFVLEHNPGYYGAAVKRNEQRAATLKDDAAVKELEDTLAAFIAAKNKLNELFAHGGKFDADKYTIQREYNVNIGDYK